MTRAHAHAQRISAPPIPAVQLVYPRSGTPVRRGDAVLDMSVSPPRRAFLCIVYPDGAALIEPLSGPMIESHIELLHPAVVANANGETVWVPLRGEPTPEHQRRVQERLRGLYAVLPTLGTLRAQLPQTGKPSALARALEDSVCQEIELLETELLELEEVTV